MGIRCVRMVGDGSHDHRHEQDVDVLAPGLPAAFHGENGFHHARGQDDHAALDVACSTELTSRKRGNRTGTLCSKRGGQAE